MANFLSNLSDDVLFAFLIPFSGMLLAGFIVFLVLYFKHQRTERMLETVQRLADRGMPVPPQLFEEPESKQRNTPLFNALTLVGVGLGLVVMFVTMNLKHISGVGFMIALIGVAQLVAIRIESRRQSRDTAANPPR